MKKPDDWGIDGAEFEQEQPPQEQPPGHSDEATALETMLRWIDEDYGDLGAPVLELMEWARLRPEMSYVDIIREVSLNWSK